MSKKIFSGLFLLFFAVSLYAEEKAVFIRGIRPLGMGGAFTAIADDQNAPFYNPAGLMQRKSSLMTVFELPVTIGQDLIEMYDYWKDNGDDLEDFDTLTDERKQAILNDITNKIGKLNPYFAAGFPNINYFSKPSEYCWGLGLYGQAGANIALRNGILVPTINVLGEIDILAVLPVAYKFSAFDLPYWRGKSFPIENISMGVNIKYINRMNISENRKSVLELEEWDPIIQKGRGFGADLGFLYPATQRITTGLMISDILGTKLSYDRETNDNGEIRESRDTVIPPAVNAGVSYVFGYPVPFLKDRLTLAADVRDIFDADQKVFDETFYTKLHLGAEYKITLFTLRGGFNQGYPTFGAGLNLYMVKLDYAYYTDELGNFAGQNPSSKHVISIALRFGAGGGKKAEEPRAKMNLGDKLSLVEYQDARLIE